MRIIPDQTVGERLRRAREDRGVDLDDAARVTRIDQRFLQALEEDAPPEAYPEEMYARAFLREYARYLGLRDRPLLQAYLALHPMRSRPPIGHPSIPLQRRHGSWGRRLLAAASVGVVATLAVLSARAARDRETVPEDVALPPSAAPPRTSAPKAPATEEPPRTYQGVQLRISVEDAPCWVSVTVGGESVLAETVDAGFGQTFRSKQGIDVVLGNPGAARLTVGGEPVHLPTTGEVYQGSWVFQGGKAKPVPPA